MHMFNRCLLRCWSERKAWLSELCRAASTSCVLSHVFVQGDEAQRRRDWPWSASCEQHPKNQSKGNLMAQVSHH